MWSLIFCPVLGRPQQTSPHLSTCWCNAGPNANPAGGVDYWRADYEDATHQWEQVMGWLYSWIRPSLLPARDRWHVPHFESLGDFGVWQGVSGGTVFPAVTCPILQGPHHLWVIQQSTGTSNLITEIQKAVTTDSYLSGVLQSVMDSDDNFFRDFFLHVREILCYQRMEDTCPRVCVPAVC